MAKEWNKYVNTKFYGHDGGYKENTEEVEFKSGRVIQYLKNSVPKKTHAVNLRCNDCKNERVFGKTEFEWFLWWYEYVIKSGSEPFYLTDLTTGSGTKEYRLKDTPSWNGQKHKEISLSLEEV